MTLNHYKVSTVLSNIITNMRDWQLIQDIAGGEKICPVELAKGKMGAAEESQSPALAPAASSPKARESIPEEPGKPLAKVVPRLQLNIEIHIAADTPDNKIEAIFRHMRDYLLKDE